MKKGLIVCVLRVIICKDAVKFTHGTFCEDESELLLRYLCLDLKDVAKLDA